MNRDILGLERQFPPSNIDDPFLDMIAGARPDELNIALKRGILGFERANIQNEESKQSIDDTWKKVRKHGEVIRGIYSNYAGDLQKVSVIYTKAGLAPPADLLDKMFDATELAEAPSEVLGITPAMDYLIEADSQMSDETQQLMDDRKPAYEVAKSVKERRNKLGRPARIATWLAGVIMVSGAGAGIAKAELNFDEEYSASYDEVAETVFKASSIGMLALIGLPGTAHTASRANNSYANRKAKKILKK